MTLLNLTLDLGDADIDRHAPAMVNPHSIAYVTRPTSGTKDSPARVHLINGSMLRVTESYETVTAVWHAALAGEWIPLSGSAENFADTVVDGL